MTTKPPSPIRYAFSRAVGAGLIWPIVGLTVVFAVAGECLLRQAARTSARAQASALAASLVTNPSVDATSSTALLLEHYQPLIAVSLADADNSLVVLSNDQPDVRELVQAALASNQPVLSHIRLGSRRESAAAVATTLGSESFRGQRVVFVLRAESHRAEWWTTLIAMAVFGVLAAKFSTVSLGRWFDTRVIHPVDALSRLAGNRSEIAARAERGHRPESTELAGSPAEFHDILHHLVEAERRLRRIEKETEQQLRAQEAGLGRKLRRAEDLATTDALTGLRNRAYFDREFVGIVQRQAERNENLAVVMIDVDNFKALNDTKGHQAGDDVLRFVGDLLGGSIRPTDHAIRYAGDEFLLLLLGVDESQASSITERVVRLFAQYAATLNAVKPPSLSAGIATAASTPGADASGLLAAADAALYRVKRSGKNAVAVSRAEQPSAGARVSTRQ